MEEFARYINTEQGLQFVLHLSGYVIVIVLMSLLFYEVCTGIAEHAADNIYRHTKHYKKKYEKLLATYDSCEDIVQDLWKEDYLEQDQYKFMLDSLFEYKERHTRG